VLVVPMLFARLMRKKVFVMMAASISKGIKYQHHTLGQVLSKLTTIVEQIIFILCDVIIVYSKSCLNDFGIGKYAYKIFADAARFVDFDLFKVDVPLAKRETLIGYIGRLSEEKGIMRFIDAIPLILRKKNDVKFILIGRGHLLNEIKNKLITDQVSNSVVIIGAVSHKDIPNYLNKLKLLVLPSYSEGLPNIVLEAMACGTPVLSAPVGGTVDLIMDGKTGFILRGRSPDYITESVIEALKDPRLNKIVNNAQDLVKERYSYETALKRYRKLFNLIWNEQL